MMMGLTNQTLNNAGILPAYIAVADSYELYYKIVEYYKQDYQCFGFKHDYYKFRNSVYTKLENNLKKFWGKRSLIESDNIDNYNQSPLYLNNEFNQYDQDLQSDYDFHFRFAKQDEINIDNYFKELAFGN